MNQNFIQFSWDGATRRESKSGPSSCVNLAALSPLPSSQLSLSVSHTRGRGAMAAVVENRRGSSVNTTRSGVHISFSYLIQSPRARIWWCRAHPPPPGSPPAASPFAQIWWCRAYPPPPLCSPLRPNRNRPYRGTATPTTADTKVVDVVPHRAHDLGLFCYSFYYMPDARQSIHVNV